MLVLMGSSYPTLTFGLGCILLIPMYMKLGRRPTILLSIVIYIFGVLGCALATSYNGFLAARIVHSLGSSVTEALPVQCVNDVYFLHERGKRISYYTVALSLGAIAPLPAGYMLAAGYGFRLFFWIEFGCAIALFIAAVLLVPETAYKRNTNVTTTGLGCDVSEKSRLAHTQSLPTESAPARPHIEVQSASLLPPRHTYLASLKPWSSIDLDVKFWMMIARSFSYWLVPQVLWVTCSYGQHRLQPVCHSMSLH